MTPYLNLVDVDVFEFLLHLSCSHFHRVHRRLRVLQRLGRVVRLLHVERLQKQVQQAMISFQGMAAAKKRKRKSELN